MKESTMVGHCKTWLNDQPQSFFVKIHGGPCQLAGISDLIGVYHGRFMAIELKVGKNKASKKQLWFLDKIINAGGAGTVCWSLDEVKTFIREEG